VPRTCSPLRYPGGKSNLFKLVRSILRENNIGRGHYAEPFAGGAGLALMLLYSGEVSEIHLNDLDPAIAAFWRAVLTETEALIEKITVTEVTVEERANQRKIYLGEQSADDLDLGFSAFFLNRVNRSGIIRTGGVIGGLNQHGRYLVDCRYNKEDLINRIRRVAKYKARIQFTALDAQDFLKSIDGALPRRSLIYADPPYFKKGAELYTSSFRPADHLAFRDRLRSLSAPWMLTYDNCPEIEQIYSGFEQRAFNIYYSAQVKRSGAELLITDGKLDALGALETFGAAKRVRPEPTAT
jgi:DNA adenine methylase